ncbi:hypothetical protein Pflav_078120 [Phytohabitans flavus]|uniref:Uncharacterized protein n=1 Tax=Phytohabitans flavus TaxID=1076124 RepID=A0A6F8Y5L1_9ACTN|nr:hypothetical protein Pflav_078120 [Phytohabitans flavus]
MEAPRYPPRPAASHPASIACRIAAAMRTGSAERVIALATITASQPSSIASAASEAVPMPASRITGRLTDWRISWMWCGLETPRPEPIGEPAGITPAQPTSMRRRARMGSSVVYGST